MKSLYLISFLLYIFTSNAFVIPTLNNDDDDCFFNYKNELLAIQTDFENEVKTCSSATNVNDCTDNALLKAETTGSDIANKIKKCIQTDFNPETFLEEIDSGFDGLSLKDSVRSDCWRKYHKEIKDILMNLKSEYSQCKSAECRRAALRNATAAVIEARKKLTKCIDEGSNPETFLDEIDSDFYGLSSKDSVQSDCWKKYRGELKDIKKNLRSELRQCKSSETAKECRKAALTKAKAAALEVRNKIKKCIEEGSNPEAFLDEIDIDFDGLSSKDSVYRDCWRKYRSELKDIKMNLRSELKQCKSSETPKDCRKAALTKAKAAALEVRNKIKKCIEEGSNPETFLEEIDSEFDGLSSKDSVQSDCWKKYRGELKDIKKNLRSELRQCKSSETPKDCRKAALTKAKAAALEVRNKIKKCIEEGSNPEAFLKEIDSDIDGLSSNDSVRRECWRNHKNELVDIKNKLLSDLKVCRSNENTRECILAALTKAKTAALEVRSKIKKCIKDGQAK